MRRFAPFHALPALLLLAAIVAPLVSGEKTLILRDVLQTHFVDRLALGEALRDLRMPLVDAQRAGGQALAGNLNALPFYPDNLLMLLGAGASSTLWALNAHFWLHWLLALAAAFWMARAFGLPAPASWMGATVYVFSGYFASQLNLYNTIAAAALAPALVAAFLETAPGKSAGTVRRGRCAAAVLWALLLLGGEPMIALLGLGAAAGALAVVAGWRAFSARLALALAAGTLLAAPQIVEMARILPLAFRNYSGPGEGQAILGSFRAAHVADLLWPFFFGRPSLAEVFAPHQFDGFPPLHFTLYPGLLALVLAAAGALSALGAASKVSAPALRPAALWGVGALAAALFFALGRFNPLVEALWHLPLGRLLRFPAKFWLLGALGGSLLCAVGFDGALTHARRTISRLLSGLAIAFALLLAGSIAAPERFLGWLSGMLQPGLPVGLLRGDLVRLQGLTLLSLGLLGAALGAVAIGRRAPRAAGVALVLLHAATQTWAMLPAVPMDAVAPYLEAPPILASIPAGSVVVHGGNHELFRPGTIFQGNYPDGRLLWLTRRSARELYPFAALAHGLRAELAISPEGLDSFLTQALTVGMKNFPDARRLDLLAALGVDYLLLDRELAADARDRVREVASDENFGQRVRLYELVDRAHEVEFATRIVRAPQMNAALAAIFDPAFDPHRTAIVPGEGAVSEPPPDVTARVSLVSESAEEVIVDSDSDAPGVVFLRRAYLDLWRVAIDGSEVPTVIAQAARLGVAVPAGRHRVRFWIDRRPTAAGGVLALAGAGLLAFVLRRPKGSRNLAARAFGRSGS